MKKLLLSSVLFAIFAFSAVKSPGQTNNGTSPAITNAIPGQPFTQTLLDYFSRFDTNSTTFHKAKEIDVMISADTQNGITSAGLMLNYSLWNALGLEAGVRNAGIGGVVVDARAGLSASRVIFDVKASAYVDGGYNFLTKSAIMETGLRVMKAATPNTAFGIGTYLQADGHGLRGGAGISLLTVITF